MKTTGLNFIEAVKAANEGKKVRRAGWDDSYVFVNHGRTNLCGSVEAINHVENILAEDWEIVPDPPKTMGFMEAMAKVKAGHGVSRNCWSNRFVRNGTFTIVVVENASRYAGNYVPTHVDIEATDWVVVED